MNRKEYDVMNAIKNNPFANQRELAELSGHSLGIVNRSVKELEDAGFLNQEQQLTEKGTDLFKNNTAKRAIILAVGPGMHTLSAHEQMPKALLKIRGERFIERQIKQLHQAGIFRICIVVGFLKEKFEYLIDKYQVELIVNPQYAPPNSIHALHLALRYLSDCYIVPCDMWFCENPFRKHEFYSWYMVGNTPSIDSCVRLNRQKELVTVPGNGNRVIGLCYLKEQDALTIRERIKQSCKEYRYNGAAWDTVLFEKGSPSIAARMVDSDSVIEVNTYEQLKEVNSTFHQRKEQALEEVAQYLQVPVKDILPLTLLKKGMTNYSFLLSCHGRQYVLRLPGEENSQGIDREQEAQVYGQIAPLHICDDIVLIDPKSGVKLSKYLKNAKSCNPHTPQDVKASMQLLKKVHQSGLKVTHEFDIWKQIDFYESLWVSGRSLYPDYADTKQKVLSLKAYLDKENVPKVLTHINPAAENFLFFINEKNEEELRLIDWEQGAMADPCLDIATFCADSLYARSKVDETIDSYFHGKPTEQERVRVYCYMAAAGLMWSNWCEYKQSLGVDFGEYSLFQYRYAKEYYKIAKLIIDKIGD